MTDYLDSRFDLDDADLVSVYDELSLWSAAFGVSLEQALNAEADASGGLSLTIPAVCVVATRS